MTNSIDIINYYITTYTEIKEVKFVKFNSYDLIQNRIALNPEISTVIESALELRDEYSLPFWDSFNLNLFNKEINNYEFLDQVKFHNLPAEINLISNYLVVDFLKSQEGNSNYLTFNSKITLKNGDNKHFPLFDFHIPPSNNNEKLCIEVLKSLGLKGFLLNSGKSYHFYGKYFITEETLTNLLSISLLYSPIIDRAWISHQLIEKSCCLRISKKYNRLPLFICEVN